MRKFDFEIEVLYDGSSNNELNARLDFVAEKSFGAFLSFTETKDGRGFLCRRSFGFDEEDLADDFREESNLIISRHFGFEPIDLDDLPGYLKWSFDEAVYHHVEFDDQNNALRFATWFRAVFGTYMEPDMYDVFVVKPFDASGGHMVIWAFPADSVIPNMSGDDLDGEIEDVMNMVNSKSDKKKVMN